MFQKKSWFTLVELIVVITILSILATIGFISFINYTSFARDSVRLTNISTIYKILEIYKINEWELPEPANNIPLSLSGVIVWIQWDIDSDILASLDITSGGTDPLDNENYSYFLSWKKAQILALLENDKSTVAYIWNKSYANNSDRFPYFSWNWLGMFLESDNTPIHRSEDVITAWEFDILWWEFGWRLVKPIFTNSSNYTARSLMVWGQLSLNSYYRNSNTCPANFIPVPWNKELWQPSFCIWKYEASWEDTQSPFTTLEWKTPLTSINISDSVVWCKWNWSNYNIMTINQWLTIARNIEEQAVNWHWGLIGETYIKWWNNWNTYNGFDNWGIMKTAETWNIHDDLRILTLSNNEEIWDFIWNAWELVQPLNLYISLNWKTELQTTVDVNSSIYSLLAENSIDGITNWTFTPWDNIIDEDFTKMYWPKIIETSQWWGTVYKLNDQSVIYVTWGDYSDESNINENWLFSILLLTEENHARVSTRCAYNY